MKTIYVGRGDTIISLATRHLGSPSRWRDIAVANNLQSPYIVADRSGRPDLRVVMPGDTLVIPDLGAPVSKTTPLRVEHSAYGIDLGWGHIEYDLLQEGNVLGLELGVQNLSKALYRRLITREGELPGHPGYHNKAFRHLGQTATPARAKLACLDLEACLKRDPRVVDAKADAVWTPDGNLSCQIIVTPIPPSETFTLPFTIEGGR